MKEQKIYSIDDGVVTSTPIVKETAKSFYVDLSKRTLFYDYKTRIPKNEACLTTNAVIARQIEILHAGRTAWAEKIKRAKKEIESIDNEIKSLSYSPCQNCKGTGAIPSSEPSLLSEYCPKCLEQGICPRCSVTWDEDIFEKFNDFAAYEVSSFTCPVCQTYKLFE